MVRRSAATHLGNFAAKVDKDDLRNKLIPMFLSIREDEQDSVRLLAVENCVAFAKLLTPKEATTHVLPTVKNCAKDDSWRVRYMVADQFKNVSFFNFFPMAWFDNTFHRFVKH